MIPTLPIRRSRHMILAVAMLCVLPMTVHGQQQRPVGVPQPAATENPPIGPAREPRTCPQALVRSGAIGAAVGAAGFVLLTALVRKGMDSDLGDFLFGARIGAVTGALLGLLFQIADQPCFSLSDSPTRR